MKRMNRLLALVLALALCCGMALAETAQSPDDVMATVNGQAITRAAFEEYEGNLNAYYTNMGYDVTTESNAAAIKEIALMTLVQYSVMDQKIVELGLSLTDEERADAEQEAREVWEETLEEGLAYYGKTETSTEAEVAALLVQVLSELESMGYTEESYIEEAVLNAGYIKLENEMVRDVVVSDEEVLAYYNELVASDQVAYANNAAAYEQVQQMNELYLMFGYTDYYTDLYYVPEGYRSVTHILLSVDEELLTAYANLQATYEEQQSTLEEGGELTGEAVTAEDVENARLAIIASVQPTIDEINQKLADGATFAELIPQYTADPGMNTAEAIAEGYAVHMDSTMWVTEFRDAAFTVDNIGDITAPVVTEHGVHILQYVADIPGGPVELTTDLMEVLRMTLLEPAQSEKLNEVMTQWMSEAEIVYSDEAQAFLSTQE
ncbi:MAG: SurA N-terminal domain-containing protein [Aristaeellaceae bacterium]